ncbi:MAG: class II aldolase/adducin family protein [Rubrobacteraceae bacterium]|uniref:class II aldolase/adducin family protein n=1 Tax=Rubrobacter naiadicus TaxID=1392641 RepID=UPI00235F2D79|nr:class II aldolase/adducin family protein [Rubrobacter naiadicus]MBX6764905.1 class II aldolase/adducin family protein [Rubrobacteraceae bacterium]
MGIGVSAKSKVDPASESVRLAREELVRISHRAYQRGLVVGVSGNNSIRVGGAEAFLIKATGCSQGDMDSQDTVLVDLEGRMLEEGKRPSKEIRWHLAIYRQNPRVGGIVHVHPPYATAWAVANRIPPLVHTAARGILKKIALIDLAPSGSEELAEMVTKTFSDENLCVALMREHGIIAVGSNLREAYYRAEYLEDTAKVALLTAQVQVLGPDGGISFTGAQRDSVTGS